MKHGSLFSGVGGFDLAAQWMGWDNIFHCDNNPFCLKVLNYYWPHAKSYTDIATADFTIHRGRTDVLSGGFPCQPWSLAGLRRGTADHRDKWPDMLRAIKQIQPRWVVPENVRGFINWNEGLVFDQMLSDLENEGYEILPLLLPAAGVNAPHKRYRIFPVAYAHHRNLSNIARKNDHFPGGERLQERDDIQEPEFTSRFTLSNATVLTKRGSANEAEPVTERWGPGAEPSGAGRGGITTDAPGIGMERNGAAGIQEPQAPAGPGLPRRDGAGNHWRDWPTESPLRGRNDGLPAGLAGITVSEHRKESIRAYGNAVVPQLVLQIFKAIEQYERLIRQ